MYSDQYKASSYSGYQFWFDYFIKSIGTEPSRLLKAAQGLHSQAKIQGFSCSELELLITELEVNTEVCATSELAKVDDLLDYLGSLCSPEDDDEYQAALELEWFLAEEPNGCIDTTAVRID